MLEAHDVVRGDGQFTQRDRMRIDAPAAADKNVMEAAEVEAQAEAEAAIEQSADIVRTKKP